MNKWIIAFLVAVLLSVAGCSHNPALAGGGLDTESSGGKLTGKVMISENQPGSFSRIDLIPQDFSPFSSCTLLTVAADSSGVYHFEDIDSGYYNIEAYDPSSGKRLLRLSIRIDLSDSITLDPDTLKDPSGIMVPGSFLPGEGTVYIPGTRISRAVDPGSSFTNIDSVPSGSLPPLLFTSSSGTESVKLTDSIKVKPGDYLIIDTQQTFPYSSLILINTDQMQNISNISGIPLLVRFTSDNFIFSQVLTSGRDIRFFAPDGSPLYYEHERWDSQNEIGETWIRIDKPLSSLQFIIMRWGNGDDENQSSPAQVFDTSLGFRGVWHLVGEKDGVRNHDLYKDATFIQGHGDDFVRARGQEGVIGPGRQFNGTNDYICIPDHPSYHFGNGPFTISLWFKITEVQRNDLFVLNFSPDNSKIGISSGSDGTVFAWTSENGILDTVCISSPLSPDLWYSLSLVRDEFGTAKLYIDGEEADEGPLNIDISSSTSGMGIILGADLSADSTAINPLGGYLDEVRIESQARTQEYIKVDFLNQKIDGTVTVLKR